MNRAGALELARRGELYPSVILHGGRPEARREAALELARALLCDREDPAARPCGTCRHCRRVRWPGGGDGGDAFHPDFQLLERDLKTSTSVDAVKELLKTAQVSPFEARGQVFVIASAESLTGEAANALLKVLEEPAAGAPRHFLLLAPSRLDLLPTLRSRSLAIFLGAAEPLEEGEAAALAEEFFTCVEGFESSRAPVYLLAAARALAAGGGWEDPRAERPWALAARAVLRGLEEGRGGGARRPLLALAEALLEGPGLRLRGIGAERILEGLVARHLSRPLP